jgi:H+/Cl- antiporter ClcA
MSFVTFGRRTYQRIQEFSRHHELIWVLYSIVAVGIVYLFTILAIEISLPAPNDLQNFSNTLWQVECSLLAFTAIVVTVIITVVSGRGDGSDVWSDYKDDSHIFPILIFHLTAIVGALAVSLFLLPAANRSSEQVNISNLVIGEIFIFLITATLAIFLYYKTFCFLNSEYIINRSKDRIRWLIRIETINENDNRAKLISDLTKKVGKDVS